MPSPNCLQDLESPLLLPCPTSLFHLSSFASGAAFGALPPTDCVGRASVIFLLESDCRCWPCFWDWEACLSDAWLQHKLLGEGVQCQSLPDFRAVRADHWSLVSTCALFSNTRDSIFPGFFKEDQSSPSPSVYYEPHSFQLLSHNTHLCHLAHLSLFTILSFILSEEK